MDLELALEPRAVIGKQTKALRRSGTVPGVVFGKDQPSVPVQVDAKQMESLYHAAGRTSIVKLTVGDGRPTSGMIKSIQRHPLTGSLLHVDFFLVDLKAEMQAEIPLVITGDAPAIANLGGSLFTQLDHIRVRALPADLPHEIAVDVSSLVDYDAAIHVSDLVVDGDRITVLNDPDEIIARVMPPRVVEEPVVAEVEGEIEGEAPESGAETGEAEGAEAETPGEDEG